MLGCLASKLSSMSREADVRPVEASPDIALKIVQVLYRSGRQVDLSASALPWSSSPARHAGLKKSIPEYTISRLPCDVGLVPVASTRVASRQAPHEALGDLAPAMTVTISGIFDERWLLEIEAIAAE